MDVECVFELTDTQIEVWRAFMAEADHAHPRQDLRYADVERASGYTP